MSDGELVNSDEGGLSDTEADLRGRLLQKRERKISEHRDDHDDAVAIKPPQAEVHHRSHHRKHRKERRKEKDLRSRSPSSKHSADHKVKKDPRDSPLRATQRKPPEVVHLEKRAEEGWAQWKKSLDGRSGSNAEPRERRRSPVVDERSRNRPRRGHSPIRVPQKVDHRDDHVGTSRRGVMGVEPRSHDRSRSPLQKSGDRTRWLPQVAPQQRSQSKHSSDERHHRRRSKESSHRRDRMSTEIVVVDKLEGGELPVSPPMPFAQGKSAEDPLVATPTQDELGDNPGENVSNDISGDGEIISDVDEESVHSSHHHSSEESSHEEVPEGSASDRSSKSSGASSDRSAGSATNGKKHHKKHIEDKRSNKYSKFETSSEDESENEDQTKSRSHSPDNAEMSPHGKASEGDHTGDEEAPSPLPEVAAEEEEPKEKEDPFALLPVYYPAISGCRSVDEFACLNRIDEGTYGVVYRCRDKRTDEMVALKRLKMEKEKDDFPITSLREIVTLLKAQHPNIITVREIVVGSNMDKIYIVMDYLEHDMKALMERMESMKKSFLIGEVKTLMRQILAGVQHLHDNWILHRDLKTSNLLLSHKGILKIGDFGLAREYGSPLKPYTQVVVTLWYRAPELLLGTKLYSTAIDVWSVGCIFGELLNLKALFPGKSEIDELGRIYRDLGTPTDKIWPGYSELPGVKRFNLPQVTHNQLRKRFGPDLSAAGFGLMNRLLTYSPEKRISAQEALKHEWFDETPHPVPPSMFPTWPAKSEMGKPVRTGNKTPPPPPGRRANDKSEADEMAKMGFQLRPGAQKPGDWHLRL